MTVSSLVNALALFFFFPSDFPFVLVSRRDHGKCLSDQHGILRAGVLPPPVSAWPCRPAYLPNTCPPTRSVSLPLGVEEPPACCPPASGARVPCSVRGTQRWERARDTVRASMADSHDYVHEPGGWGGPADAFDLLRAPYSVLRRFL